MIEGGSCGTCDLRETELSLEERIEDLILVLEQLGVEEYDEFTKRVSRPVR